MAEKKGQMLHLLSEGARGSIQAAADEGVSLLSLKKEIMVCIFFTPFWVCEGKGGDLKVSMDLEKR